MLLFSSILSSFIDDKDNPRKQASTPSSRQKSPAHPFDADPIKFTLQADKQTARIGEEITLTITAHYLNIPSALLFTAAGSTAFRLKVLLPDGFVQTGGDYIDYIGTELSPVKPTAVYTLKGYFSKSGSKTEFRLLRSHGHADASSLFVEKARLSIQATVIDLSQQSQKSAREGSCNYSEGQFLFTTSWGESVYAHYYNGSLFAAAQNGDGFKPQHWLVATGQMSSNVASCFAENDPHTSTQPSNNPPPSGSLAFQVVSYNCTSGVLQYQFTGGNGSPINVSIPGVFGGTMNANTVATTTFPSDARTAGTMTGTATQSGNTISINFAKSCNPTTTPPPTNPPTGNCPYTEGQYLFTFQNAEAIYAHFYNGILFAAYQDGSNFKPQHWLVATGLMTTSVASCFAENDPHTTTTNPPTGGGNGNGLAGNYFTNTSLSGNPVLSRIESTINFTWDGGGSSPFPGVPASNMSVRWEGQVEAPATGTYTFSTNNDDATQLWVNGQQLISDWPGGHAPTLKSGTISLQAGQKYSIKLEFNQGSGGAQAQLLWSYPGQGQQIIPQSRLYSNVTTPTTSNCGTGSGLTGFYSNSSDLSTNLVGLRNDGSINFVWGNDSPMPGVVNADVFSVRWVGQVEAPISGNYTFKTNNDDGTRVWVNKKMLINDWNGHGPTWQQGSIYLTGGQKYDIVMDFADFGGGAQAQLIWEYYGQYAQVIPSCRLYPLISSPPSNPLALVDRKVYTVEVDDVYITFDIDLGQITYIDGNTASYSDNYSGDQTNVSDNTYDGSVGGNVPGGATSTTPPDFDVQYASAKAAMLSAFYAAMAQKRILFSDQEKEIIGQYYPKVMNNIKAYVDQYGTKPDGRNTFILSFADQQRFPNFAKLVKQLPQFLSDNPKAMNALKKYTGFSEAKIKDLIKDGSGPQINIVYDLRSPKGYPALGLCDCADVGQNPQDFKISIKEEYVRAFEIDNSNSSRFKATAFLLAVTVLHEFVHWSRSANPNLNDFPIDFGDAWEIESFGIDVEIYNAGKASYLLKKIR